MGYYFFIQGLIIRTIFLWLTDGWDFDANGRVIEAMMWLTGANESFLPANFEFGPLQFYLSAFFIYLFKEPILAPRLCNVLLGSFSLLFYFFLIKNIFNQKIAIIATFLFSLWAIHIKLSVLTTGEVVFIYLFILSFLSLVYFLKDKRYSSLYLVCSSFFLNLAAMTRFEAWLFIPFFAVLAIKKDKKKGVIYGLSLVTCPAVFSLFAFIETGDFFIFHTNTSKNCLLTITNDYGERLFILYRTIFNTLSPSVVIFSTLGLIASLLKKNNEPVLNKKQLLLKHYAFIVLTVFLIFNYKALAGTVNFAFGRYTLILGLLLFPFFSYFFECVIPFKKTFSVKIFFILSLAIFLLYMSYGVVTYKKEVTIPKNLKSLLAWIVPQQETILIDLGGGETSIFLFSRYPLPKIFNIIYGDSLYDLRTNIYNMEPKKFIEEKKPFYIIIDTEKGRIIKDKKGYALIKKKYLLEKIIGTTIAVYKLKNTT